MTTSKCKNRFIKQVCYMLNRMMIALGVKRGITINELSKKGQNVITFFHYTVPEVKKTQDFIEQHGIDPDRAIGSIAFCARSRFQSLFEMASIFIRARNGSVNDLLYLRENAVIDLALNYKQMSPEQIRDLIEEIMYKNVFLTL